MAVKWNRRLYLSEPVISKLTNIKLKVISEKIDNTEEGYREFTVPKHNGGRRSIVSPSPALASVQKAIARRLESCVTFSDYIHGYVPDKSVITNASAHIEGSNFLKLDIENFFPSLSSALIRREIADHCHDKQTLELLLRFCTLNEALPQGAPSSPVLSNILLGALDKKLEKQAANNSLKYTRYADDITVSGERISIKDRDEFYKTVEDFGLKINQKKSILITAGRKVIITGISISRSRLCLPRKRKRAIRLNAHLILKNGIIEESNKMGVFNPFYVDRILGQLSFWQNVEPENPYPREHIKEIKKLLSELVE